MSRTITALFDTREDADAGRQRLLAANVDADNVRIHDQSSMSSSMGTTSSASSSSMSSSHSSEDSGIWGSIKNAFLPDEDRHTYEEGIRRGGYLLTADVDGDEVDAAVRALEDANSVDIDERSDTWRSEGWSTPTASATPAFFGNDRDRTMSDSDEQSIPVIEEQLVVGKREVERGGVRVRSYVTEVPVHEQIRLRQENVSVERRPVDRQLSDIDSDAFQERNIEMTETSEEAVVGKTARVVEEVVVRKSADERVEEVNETVRRTDVDIEDLGSNGINTDRNAAYDRSTSEGGSTLSGLANEGMGNVKQGIGSLTGNEELERKGEAQERSGEMQQGKTPSDKY